jgi:hypothetical protein
MIAVRETEFVQMIIAAKHGRIKRQGPGFGS